MPAKLNLTGQKFGRLTVVGLSGVNAGKTHWLCKCECGTVKEVRGAGLRQGKAQSCGCIHSEMLRDRNRTHGGKGTRAYVIWQSMKQRCSNRRHENFKDYGGRGITVCERWVNSFENFLADMGEPPTGLTLDRYPDTDGNYEPGNCRWADAFQQARNTRKALKLTYNGTTKPLRDWAEEYGFVPRTLASRIKAGWSVEKAIETPTAKTYTRRSA